MTTSARCSAVWSARTSSAARCLVKPGSIKPHTKFKAEVYVLTKEEGGRHTPFFNGYRPQFYFRTTDVTGVVQLPEGTEMVMPGDNITMEVELIAPIAVEEGTRFAIREGGRTVGAGVVSQHRQVRGCHQFSRWAKAGIRPLLSLGVGAVKLGLDVEYACVLCDSSSIISNVGL